MHRKAHIDFELNAVYKIQQIVETHLIINSFDITMLSFRKQEQIIMHETFSYIISSQQTLLFSNFIFMSFFEVVIIRLGR